MCSDKDRAENVMIVDLLRNDLGRACQPGSIQVPQLVGLESYASVHHLTSVVEGQLQAGLSWVDLLEASWPGGSISGAPKLRACQRLHELEPTSRGPYCGSLLRIDWDGSFDSNILIRSLLRQGDTSAGPCRLRNRRRLGSPWRSRGVDVETAALAGGADMSTSVAWIDGQGEQQQARSFPSTIEPCSWPMASLKPC